jgi:hypothetical protein
VQEAAVLLVGLMDVAQMMTAFADAQGRPHLPVLIH